MTSDHHQNLAKYLEKFSITDRCQNELKTPDFPLIVSDLNFNEATLFAAYCYIRNFIGTSVNSSATIDTKIEYAMDVVKNHLTQAVRLEVEDLKIKINELAARISYLEYENGILRANVAPEVLENLNSTGKM